MPPVFVSTFLGLFLSEPLAEPEREPRQGSRISGNATNLQSAGEVRTEKDRALVQLRSFGLWFFNFVQHSFCRKLFG